MWLPPRPQPPGHSGPHSPDRGSSVAWSRAPGCPLPGRRQGPQVPKRPLCLSLGVGSVSLTVRFRFEVSQLRPQTGPHLGSLCMG